jgi:hypothetical protein
LIECTTAVLEIDGRSAHDIFGSLDDLKLSSYATLLGLVSQPDSPFASCSRNIFDGERDELTLRLLGRRGQRGPVHRPAPRSACRFRGALGRERRCRPCSEKPVSASPIRCAASILRNTS